MSLDWQTLISLACVIGAGVVIARRVWTFLNPQETGCGGGCHGCASASTSPGNQGLVTLSLPEPRGPSNT